MYSKPLTSHRSIRQSTIAGVSEESRHKTLLATAVTSFGLLWTIAVGLCFFTLGDNETSLRPAQINQLRDDSLLNDVEVTSDLFDDFPAMEIDLWPDDRQDAMFRNAMLWNQFVDEDDPSTTNDSASETPVMVYLLRPPGVLGETMDRLLRHSLLPPSGPHPQRDNLQVVGTSHDFMGRYAMLEQASRPIATHVIRVATTPVLLEAFDLALLAVSHNTSSTNSSHRDNDTFLWDIDDISIDDILGIVRQIVRWHCWISQSISRANINDVNLALPSVLSVTLSHTTTYPETVSETVRQFLGQPTSRHFHPGDKSLLEHLAQPLLLRIDECIAAAHRVMEPPPPGSNDVRHRRRPAEWATRVQQALEEEVRSALVSEANAFNRSCRSTRPIVDDGGSNALDRDRRISHSPITELVGDLLDPNPTFALAICNRFPTSQYCHSK